MEYLSSWISPGAAFFLFVNVLIGAIVVTSRGQQGGRAASTRRLCRSASSMVLDRLRSFSMFSFQFQPDDTFEECYHTSLELEAEEQQQQPEPPAVVEPPPSAPAAAAAVDPSGRTNEEEEEGVAAGEDESVISSDKADGTSSLQGDAELSPSSAGDAAVVAAAEPTAAVAESQLAKVAGAAAMPIARAGACRQEAVEGKATLNARAELFIRQFKEDLKLQRLNSIMNYTRALRRGAGAAQATEHQ